MNSILIYVIKLMIMLLKALNRTLEEYNIPKEEFWEDPYGFIDKLEDEDLKWLLLMEMEAMD